MRTLHFALCTLHFALCTFSALIAFRLCFCLSYRAALTPRCFVSVFIRELRTAARKCCAPSMRETLLAVIQQQCLMSGLEFAEEIEESDVLVEESPPRSPLHARDGSEQRAAAAPPKRRRSPSPTFDTSHCQAQTAFERQCALEQARLRTDWCRGDRLGRLPRSWYDTINSSCI